MRMRQPIDERNASMTNTDVHPIALRVASKRTRTGLALERDLPEFREFPLGVLVPAAATAHDQHTISEENPADEYSRLADAHARRAEPQLGPQISDLS